MNDILKTLLSKNNQYKQIYIYGDLSQEIHSKIIRFIVKEYTQIDFYDFNNKQDFNMHSEVLIFENFSLSNSNIEHQKSLKEFIEYRKKESLKTIILAKKHPKELENIDQELVDFLQFGIVYKI